ncbi:hypothetical protein HDV05_001930 [Chytridiales sp. JEL 0842]|nr:hypothetical protein HDV05_001930 [Chytridiales sp. JEL 0842]
MTQDLLTYLSSSWSTPSDSHLRKRNLSRIMTLPETLPSSNPLGADDANRAHQYVAVDPNGEPIEIPLHHSKPPIVASSRSVVPTGVSLTKRMCCSGSPPQDRRTVSAPCSPSKGGAGFMNVYGQESWQYEGRQLWVSQNAKQQEQHEQGWDSADASLPVLPVFAHLALARQQMQTDDDISAFGQLQGYETLKESSEARVRTTTSGTVTMALPSTPISIPRRNESLEKLDALLKGALEEGKIKFDENLCEDDNKESSFRSPRDVACNTSTASSSVSQTFFTPAAPPNSLRVASVLDLEGMSLGQNSSDFESRAFESLEKKSIKEYTDETGRLMENDSAEEGIFECEDLAFSVPTVTNDNIRSPASTTASSPTSPTDSALYTLSTSGTFALPFPVSYTPTAFNNGRRYFKPTLTTTPVHSFQESTAMVSALHTHTPISTVNISSNNMTPLTVPPPPTPSSSFRETNPLFELSSLELTAKLNMVEISSE